MENENLLLNRKETILSSINISQGRGIEIGPLDNPLVSRVESKILYADHADQKTLQLKYQNNSRVDPKKIPAIDLVLSEQVNLQTCVNPESIDYIVASHVIEHVPNLVAFLKQTNSVLRDGGHLCLAVPDKRYTFDVFRRITFPDDVFDAEFQDRTRPSLDQVVDHHKNKVNFDRKNAWDNYHAEVINSLSRNYDRKGIENLIQRHMEGEYLDVHCWVFTPNSFMNLIPIILKKYEIPFIPSIFRKTEFGRNEFIVQLKKCSNQPNYINSWERYSMAQDGFLDLYTHS